MSSLHILTFSQRKLSSTRTIDFSIHFPILHLIYRLQYHHGFTRCGPFHQTIPAHQIHAQAALPLPRTIQSDPQRIRQGRAHHRRGRHARRREYGPVASPSPTCSAPFPNKSASKRWIGHCVRMEYSGRGRNHSRRPRDGRSRKDCGEDRSSWDFQDSRSQL